MDKGICRLCGKEGTWERVLSRGHEFNVLKHYCPVKVAKKKAIKDAAIEKQVVSFLKSNKYDMWLGWFHNQGILFQRYPHKPETMEEIFSGVVLTDEEKKARKAHADAIRRYQEAVYAYIEKNRKFPTCRRYQMIAEKV